MSAVAAPRLSRIAVGVDFAEPSRAAAAWVARTLAPTAELLLVHAVDNAVPHEMVPYTEPDEVGITAAMRLAEERLAALDLNLRDGRVAVRTGSDRPAAVIGKAAESWGADLIVIGPHGSSPSEWKPLGGTAERLVRTSSVPVLTVPVPPAWAPRKILVPVDRVDLTPAVLAWARSIAACGAGEVILLHVVADGEPEEDAAAWLEELASELPNEVQRELLVERGMSGAVVSRVARRTGADFIVMGRRGRGRAVPAVLGSTVSDVLRASISPVLVVTDPRDAVLDSWDVN